jgi:hypothetical protein
MRIVQWIKKVVTTKQIRFHREVVNCEEGEQNDVGSISVFFTSRNLSTQGASHCTASAIYSVMRTV